MLNKRLAVALTVSGLLAGATACGAPAQTSPASATPSATTATTAEVTGWELDPASGAQRIKAAGLDILTAEGTAEHYHAHLDVLVDGKAVTVPAEIGFSFGADGQPNGISALHTHDTSGVIHIEAPTAGQKYTLGQVLSEWGVLDGKESTGAPHGGTGGWTAYVNGAKQDVPVSGVVLKAHDEVVLSYGAAPSPVPGSYNFPAGL
ncbi:hypothetical protein [Arthrobacter bambusae]|uniref:hypothetical protein n=1 Tax=Arthrobacter bambusae TaxID=1338426 RepID=UPI002781C515|nr:hypothetical protein [Arthrobacter bambusae]MDQ0031334.1 hypothetical protein [Arthrobacter bambusae]MDQ0099557.1 hypothetical protein [Arthrobacter bambusae]